MHTGQLQSLQLESVSVDHFLVYQGKVKLAQHEAKRMGNKKRKLAMLVDYDAVSVELRRFKLV